MLDSTLLTGLEEALQSLGLDDYLALAADSDPVSWTEYHRILKGKKFSFNNREYLLQPYRDESPNLIFYKGRQVEMSEFSINWLMRKLNAYPYTAGLHAFPRAKQAERFSKQRIEAAIKASPTLAKWYDERNSELTMRRFARFVGPTHSEEQYNFYILGATWESRKDTVADATRSTTLDFVVYDERQDHPDDVETVLNEGMSHSEYKQSLTLGTPKLPGTQFDTEWETSTKNYWYVKCECGREAPVTLENVLKCADYDESGNFYYGCPGCGRPLIRTQGMWQSTNPQKRPRYVGYHINQLMVPWITANEIMDKYTDPKYSKRRFFNEVIGEAYGGDDIPITPAMMQGCVDDFATYGLPLGPVSAGIDWGNTSYCWVEDNTSDGHGIVDLLMEDSADPRKHPIAFARALRKYSKQLHQIVCDAGPDIMRYYQLYDACRSEGITCPIWPCYYGPEPAKDIVKWTAADKKDKPEEHHVTVGRSEMIERVIDELHDKRLRIPRTALEMEAGDTMMDQMTNIAGVRVRSNNDVEYIQYQATGPDHFLHAKIYADVASEGMSSIAIATSIPQFMAQQRQHELRNGSIGIPNILGGRSRHKELSETYFPKFQKPIRRR